MSLTQELKVLLFDTELSYGIYYAFPSKKPQFLSSKNIIHQQFMPCAAWQWAHEVSRYVVKITDDQKRFKKDFRDDYIVAKKMHDLMSEADVLVAHNGDAFDIKHLNVLFRRHKLGPIPEKKSVDTLKAARKYFNFAGNDLDSLSKLFGGKGKNRKPCWFKLTEGNEKEISLAATYCKNDVAELERVFIEIRPYIRNLPKIRSPVIKNNYGIIQCDACGSKRLHNKGLEGGGGKPYPRVKCSECTHEMKGDMKLWKKAHPIK